jgi:uridine monophosphate synthetase
MQLRFIDKLLSAIERNQSLLCVGLDPEPARLSGATGDDEERLIRWSNAIIEQTADLACCYKPNFAFYEQYGPEGLSALRQVIARVPNAIPVLLDGKRGDIGSTAAAYARAAFEVWGADAITVSPYLGQDSVAPFLAYPGKAVFLLCQTSNPSAAEIQNFGVEPLYQHVARLGQSWGDATQIGFVVGATQVEALARVRALAPDRWLLAPGIGAQGGDLDAAMAAGLMADGSGVMVPVSRAVIYADEPRQAALILRDRINQAASKKRLAAQSEMPAAGSQDRAGAVSRALLPLVLALHDAGCVKFGNFTLASGKPSPIYIDLRRVISYPALFRQVVNAYLDLARALRFDRLAAVPYAALPVAAAIALALHQPLIYSRKEVKAHGTGQAIEGMFEKGQRALVVEDVVTTGGSILTAIQTLEQAGLVVGDIVVLVDREQGARAALSAAGYHLHALLTISQILEGLRDRQRISLETYQTVKTHLAQGREEGYVKS